MVLQDCMLLGIQIMSCLADSILISAGAVGRAPGSSPVGREHEEHADSGVLAKDRNERQVLHRVSNEVVKNDGDRLRGPRPTARFGIRVA